MSCKPLTAYLRPAGAGAWLWFPGLGNRADQRQESSLPGAHRSQRSTSRLSELLAQRVCRLCRCRTVSERLEEGIKLVTTQGEERIMPPKVSIS